MALTQNAPLTAVNDAITMKVYGKRCTAGFQYPTGGTGTLAPEGTINGIHWVAIQVTSAADATVKATTIAAAGLHYADVSHFAQVRLRKSVGTDANLASMVLNFD